MIERPLPLNTFGSSAPFVIYAPQEGLISEHETSPEAIKAFAAWVSGTDQEGAIYRSVLNGWEVH